MPIFFGQGEQRTRIGLLGAAVAALPWQAPGPAVAGAAPGKPLMGTTWGRINENHLEMLGKTSSRPGFQENDIVNDII